MSRMNMEFLNSALFFVQGKRKSLVNALMILSLMPRNTHKILPISENILFGWSKLSVALILIMKLAYRRLLSC